MPRNPEDNTKNDSNFTEIDVDFDRENTHTKSKNLHLIKMKPNSVIVNMTYLVPDTNDTIFYRKSKTLSHTSFVIVKKL